MIKTDTNSVYINILAHITKNAPFDSYIVLGSMSTLSYTSKISYTRKMNDLDIIADESQVKQMKMRLIKNGYEQTTFINKRMPFNKKLFKHSRSIYLRFSKGDINVEILSTKIIKQNSRLKFDLYPNFWVEIPEGSLYKTKIGTVGFTTLDVNLLWTIKYLLHNSLGKFMHYKSKQRSEDLLHLRKLVDIEKAKIFLSQCRFGFRSLSFAIPGYFLR
jgi:hypothetical protein